MATGKAPEPAASSLPVCKLLSVETPLNPTFTEARYTFELLINDKRVAQFDEDSFRRAVEAVKILKDTGVCGRIELDERSNLVIPY